MSQERMLDLTAAIDVESSNLATSQIGDSMARRRGQFKPYVYARGNSWLVQFRVDTLDVDAQGRPKRKMLTRWIAEVGNGPGQIPRKNGKSRARALAQELYLSKLAMINSRPSTMKTIAQFVEERFKPDVVEKCRPSGKAHYTYLLRCYVIKELGAIRLCDLTPQKVQALLNAVLVKGCSVQTAKHVKNCISAIYRHAKGMQMYSGDLPTDAVRLPDLHAPERKVLNWDQIEKLIARIGHLRNHPKKKHAMEPDPKKMAIDNQNLGALVLVLSVTGLRIGEALGLRWKRVNLTDQVVTVDGELLPPHTLAVRESYVLGNYGPTKTGKSRRVTPLTTLAVAALEKVKSLSRFTKPDDPVFAGQKLGKPLDQHNIARRFLKPAACEIGVPWVSWHTFRHTQSSLADQAGLSVTERQRLLGHSSAAMTLHYSHAELEHARELLEKIGQKTGPKGGEEEQFCQQKVS